MLIGLLEDDLAIQEMLRLVLECAGHEVILYANAEACLAALRVTEPNAAPLSPDLCIIDMHLPKSASGLAVIASIRANPRLNALPLILMTASAFPDTQELQRLRVTLLAKPFDIDEVVRLIDELTVHRS